MLNRKLDPPRGILHLASIKPSPGLERFLPSEQMSALVEHYWTVSWVHQPKELRETVPHPSVHLVFESNATELHGIHLKRFSRWIEGTGRVLGVKFRPSGFRAFTTSKLNKLTNTVTHPSTVFGPSVCELESRVIEMEKAEAAFEQIDAYLLSRKPQCTEEMELCNRIVQFISDVRSITRVETLCEEFGMGLRTLQRLFTDNVGVSPKWVIQRYRLIEAAERIRTATEPANYAGLAAELGYSDQSHFIRDFKTMVGHTPAKYWESVHKAN